MNKDRELLEKLYESIKHLPIVTIAEVREYLYPEPEPEYIPEPGEEALYSNGGEFTLRVAAQYRNTWPKPFITIEGLQWRHCKPIPENIQARRHREALEILRCEYKAFNMRIGIVEKAIKSLDNK